jgi:hypothetical protein
MWVELHWDLPTSSGNENDPVILGVEVFRDGLLIRYR